MNGRRKHARMIMFRDDASIFFPFGLLWRTNPLVVEHAARCLRIVFKRFMMSRYPKEEAAS
jgi:hypothetical protein